MLVAYSSPTVDAAAERRASKFAEARRLQQEWVLAVHDHLVEPTAERLAIRERAYTAYKAEQDRAFNGAYEQQRRAIGFQQR